MELGVMLHLVDENIDDKFKRVKEHGFEWCQICCWNHSLMTEEIAQKIDAARDKYNIKVSTFWCGYSGKVYWNFYEGQNTLGIVPLEYREMRCNELCHGSDFAKRLGIDQIATHMGYLYENPMCEDYPKLIDAIRGIANHCKANGQKLLFETGQETPVTLRRVIEDVGTGNLGINLDPANLILYGKGNPIDALDVFGNYVCDIHAKDGEYPTNGRNLGKETVVGKGKVNFPKFIEKLKEIGYDRTLIIEREISGEQQIKDINCTKIYLEELIGLR